MQVLVVEALGVLAFLGVLALLNQGQLRFQSLILDQFLVPRVQLGLGRIAGGGVTVGVEELTNV